MTHVIFDLCIRDGACVEVCPVECIIPGQPEEEWPWYYIDPDTCIDCGACIPECPTLAILPEEDLPEDQQYATELNALFFTDGPGYAALNMGK
jgi:ferredoxin--NADP+ reductase